MFKREVIVEGKFIQGKFVKGSSKITPLLFQASMEPQLLGVQALDDFIKELKQIRVRLIQENMIAIKEQEEEKNVRDTNAG